MKGRFSEHELLFVREVLDDHGVFVIDALHYAIEERKLRDSDKLHSSLDYNVTHYGENPVLQLSFYSYGRAIEIRFHKHRKNNDLFKSNSSRDAFGIAGKRKRRKKTDWYARNVYGSINRLLSVLGTQYIESERRKIVESLGNQKTKLS